MVTLLSIALSLFLLMDSVGNIPLYLSFLKGIPLRRRSVIIVREMLIALCLIILCNFIGEALMAFLHVDESTIQIAGGIILFLIAIRMIFPHEENPHAKLPREEEPFIVPLAVPLIAGPSVLSAVMIYARQEPSNWIMVGAILLAWAASLLILLASSYLEKLLTWRGIVAIERLMGLILTLISVQMFLTGLAAFLRLT